MPQPLALILSTHFSPFSFSHSRSANIINRKIGRQAHVAFLVSEAFAWLLVGAVQRFRLFHPPAPAQGTLPGSMRRRQEPSFLEEGTPPKLSSPPNAAKGPKEGELGSEGGAAIGGPGDEAALKNPWEESCDRWLAAQTSPEAPP
jgi:hypothetical protein